MPKNLERSAAGAAAAVTVAAVAVATALFAVVGLSGCSQESAAAIYPSADLQPPGLLAAGPADARNVRLRFDEAVTPVEGSFSALPQAALSCRAEERDLIVSFASDQAPGADYSLTGEVDDLRGNRTRFLLRFVGWNDRAPRLRISEVQTGKNSSKTKPHRDFIELEVLEDGNAGGEEISWTSSVKSSTYRFPGIELRRGDFLVLHLAPELSSEERDELGGDLAASGGIDATATGRDLWCPSMPLPDESGVISLSQRPGSPAIDALFYADDGRSGGLSDDRLSQTLLALKAAGAWPLAGSTPAWEDGFRWNSSPAKSICRAAAAAGPPSWYATATGEQSPGVANAGPASAVASKAIAGSKALKPARKSTVRKPKG